MRPRAGLLAGEEGARGGVVVGDGGTGVRGGTKLRGFRRGVNDSEQIQADQPLTCSLDGGTFATAWVRRFPTSWVPVNIFQDLICWLSLANINITRDGGKAFGRKTIGDQNVD